VANPRRVILRSEDIPDYWPKRLWAELVVLADTDLVVASTTQAGTRGPIRRNQHRVIVAGLAAVLCLTLFGCESSNPLIPPPTTVRCQNGPTRPITVIQLRDALDAKGFSVFVNPYSDLCGGDTEIELANLLFFGPNANIDEHTRIIEEQGNLGCALRTGPLYADRRVRVSRQGGVTWMFLENAECGFIPSETGGERQVARLRAALTSLQASP
jgi:hypothetical protein